MPRQSAYVVGVTALLLLVAYSGRPQAATLNHVNLAPFVVAATGCGSGIGLSCGMPDGCPGIWACIDDVKTCTYKGTGTRSCTACPTVAAPGGQTGTQACGVNGPEGACNVPTLSQACPIADGCPGIQTCNAVPGGTWSACGYATSGSRSCTACGQGGTQACNSSGPYGACNVSSLSQVCPMADGCPGTQTCNNVPNGTWNSCSYNASGTRTCSACGQSGTQACGTSGPSGNCNVSTLSQTCTNGCGSGTQTCNNIPGGTWNGCVVPPRGCGSGGCSGTQACVNGAWAACANCNAGFICHTTAGDACGTTGTIACNASCQPVSSTCTIAEVCNNCDDNGDGRIDEGATCSPCGL